MRVLGIETSCDETGVALYDSERGLLDHLYHSQVNMHLKYGGVVPEIASRDHIQKLSPLVQTLLDRVHCTVNEIDGVAYTAGPGLAGALLVGASFARSLALAQNIPAVGIHHMEGHLLSPFLEKNTPQYPFVALLVSGGHTLLVRVDGVGQYHLLGQSLDDAAGEAFDKIARLMGLGYPGGPALAKLAKNGNPQAFHLPRPMLRQGHLNFSFSGLKTAVANLIHQNPSILEVAQEDLAASFQEAVVDTLTTKSIQALEETGLRQLIVAGGVSANECLREQLEQKLAVMNTKIFYPRLEFCTDNGAMIAYAGYLRLKAGQHHDLDFSVKPRWSLSDLMFAF